MEIQINIFIIILIILISTAIGFFIAKSIYIHKSYEKGKSDGAFEKEKDIFYDELDNKQTFESELLNSKLELNFHKGKEEGRNEERERWNVHVDPKLEIRDRVFRKTIKTGYSVRVTYDGFPVGGEQYQELKSIEKFKQENYNQVLKSLNSAVENFASGFLNRGIKTIVNKVKT